MNYLQIPKEIWPHISRLSSLQLAIYCDAITWESQGGTARRSNDTIAAMFGVTSRAVTKSVTRLVELGLVEIEIGANNIRTIKPRTGVLPNERSPRTIVHPEQVFTPTPNECSMQPRTSVRVSPERVFTQEEKREEKREEQREEKGTKPKKEATPKDLQTIIDTFTAAGSTAELAERFFNYYESVGWVIGRARKPMKDWKATARDWIKRQTTYDNEQPKFSPGGGAFHSRISQRDAPINQARTLEWANK